MSLSLTCPKSKKTCRRSLFVLEYNRLKIEILQLIHIFRIACQNLNDEVNINRNVFYFKNKTINAHELNGLIESYNFSVHAKVDSFYSRCSNRNFFFSVNRSGVGEMLRIQVEYFDDK